MTIKKKYIQNVIVLNFRKLVSWEQTKVMMYLLFTNQTNKGTLPFSFPVKGVIHRPLLRVYINDRLADKWLVNISRLRTRTRRGEGMKMYQLIIHR